MKFVIVRMLITVIVGLALLLESHANAVAQDSLLKAVEAKADALEWVTMTPTGARAAFEMPTKPRFVERKFPPIPDRPPIKVRLYLSTNDEGTKTFVFGYHDLHEKPANATVLKNSLDGAVRGSVVNVFGQLVPPEDVGLKKNPMAIKYGEYPGRAYIYRFAQNEKPFVVTARVFIVGKRQYQLSCIMADDVFDEVAAVKFLNSFRLIIPESDLPPRPKASK